MKVKIWGCRGSISCPGPNTVRYGGNTTCYEIRNNAGDILVIDAGTGIRELGNALAAEMPLEATLVFSHTHYDHVIGYPFFVPFFVPGNKIDLYGPVHFERSFRSVMTEQLDYSFFPVRMDELAATLTFHDLKEESFEVKGFKVKTLYANHPVTTLAYRIEADGKSFIFSGDTEPYLNYFDNDPDADEDELEEVQAVINEQNQRWNDFLKDADLCFHDAQYTPEEYENFKGWGHTPMDVAIDNCAKAGVKKLILTHHDPKRTDDQLDDLLPRWQKYIQENNLSIDIDFAREGESHNI